MSASTYPKIKNSLTRLAYLLSQTTRPELGEATIDALQYHGKDDEKFLSQSQAALQKILNFQNILPKEIYLLALATFEEAEHHRAKITTCK